MPMRRWSRGSKRRRHGYGGSHRSPAVPFCSRRAVSGWSGDHALGFLQATSERVPVDLRRGGSDLRPGWPHLHLGQITAGIDLALALVEEDLGRDIARLVARVIIMFPRRPGGQSQFTTYLGSKDDSLRDSRWFQTWVVDQPDADLSRQALSSVSVEAYNRPYMRGLQAWILAHLDFDLSIDALSERMAMSPRNFARVFMTVAGMTPAKFVEQARIEAARCKLEQTALPIEAIAEHCGFGDRERMRRSFRRVLRVSPQDYRARFKSTVLH